ncbi:MAG TPA: hypothetical protein VGJ60_10590 [Chloroflexota bacterium]
MLTLRRSAVAAALMLVVLACGAPAAAPTPAPTRPLPTATPPVTPVPTLDAATFDIQDAFLTNVNDLTSEVETLATAECADLSAELRANPTEVTEMRGFAATLQRVGGQQPALSNSEDVKASLSDLSKAMAQLEAALSRCGL